MLFSLIENILRGRSFVITIKDSIIKTDSVYKLSDKQILFKNGEIEKERIEEYKQSFYDTLKENNQ